MWRGQNVGKWIGTTASRTTLPVSTRALLNGNSKVGDFDESCNSNLGICKLRNTASAVRSVRKQVHESARKVAGSSHNSISSALGSTAAAASEKAEARFGNIRIAASIATEKAEAAVTALDKKLATKASGAVASAAVAADKATAFVENAAAVATAVADDAAELVEKKTRKGLGEIESSVSRLVAVRLHARWKYALS